MRTEQKTKKMKTPEVSPLYYGIRFGNVFFPASSFAIGTMIITPGEMPITPEEALDNSIRKWQEYAKELYNQGNMVVSEKYLLAMHDKPGSDLDHGPDTLREKIRNGLYDEYKTVKLWDIGPEEAIKTGHLENRRLTARVASRRDPKKDSSVLEHWLVVVDSPLYNEKTGVDYKNVSCQSDDFPWGGTSKGTLFLCAHSAAAIIQACREYPGVPKGRIKFVEPKGMPFVPFTLSPETVMDVIVRHYYAGERFYEINKMLHDNPDNYDLSFLQALENDHSGLLTFEAVPKKYVSEIVVENSVEEGVIKAKRWIRDEVRKNLAKEGYKKIGIYAVEFKDTEYETLCEDFQRGTNVLRILFKGGIPILVDCKELSEEKVLFYKPQQLPNPVTLLNEQYEDVDDMRRVRCKSTIKTPANLEPYLSSIPIPYILKKQYRDAIDRFPPEKKSKLIRALRLY
jgi:hypothetical protein